MLELGHRDDEWVPPVVRTVATEGRGTDELLDAIVALRAHLAGPVAAGRRRARAAALLRRLLAARLGTEVDRRTASSSFDEVVGQVGEGTLDPYTAVDALFDA